MPGMRVCGGAGTWFLALVRGLTRRSLRDFLDLSDRRDRLERSRDFPRCEGESRFRRSLRERPRDGSLVLRLLFLFERSRSVDLRFLDGSRLFRSVLFLLGLDLPRGLRSERLVCLEGLLGDEGER